MSLPGQYKITLLQQVISRATISYTILQQGSKNRDLFDE